MFCCPTETPTDKTQAPITVAECFFIIEAIKATLLRHQIIYKPSDYPLSAGYQTTLPYEVINFNNTWIVPDKLIGAGAFGEVHRAIDLQATSSDATITATAPTMAYKLINKFSSYSLVAKEAETMCAVSGDPRCTHTPLSDTSSALLVMPLYPGENLLDYVQSHSLNYQQKLALIIRLLEAYQQLHTKIDPRTQKPIAHLDANPYNIIVNSNPQQNDFTVNLCDFGLCSTTITEYDPKGLVAPAYGFVAPEFETGPDANNAIEQDIFSLSALISGILDRKASPSMRRMQLAKNEEHLTHIILIMLTASEEYTLENIQALKLVPIASEAPSAIPNDLAQKIFDYYQKNRGHLYQTVAALKQLQREVAFKVAQLIRECIQQTPLIFDFSNTNEITDQEFTAIKTHLGHMAAMNPTQRPSIATSIQFFQRFKQPAAPRQQEVQEAPESKPPQHIERHTNNQLQLLARIINEAQASMSWFTNKKQGNGLKKVTAIQKLQTDIKSLQLDTSNMAAVISTLSVLTGLIILIMNWHTNPLMRFFNFWRPSSAQAIAPKLTALTIRPQHLFTPAKTIPYQGKQIESFDDFYDKIVSH